MKINSMSDAVKRMPQYLYDQLLEQYDRNVVDTIVKGYMAERSTTLRVNRIKTDALTVLNALKEAGIKADRVSFSEDLLIIKNGSLKQLQELEIYKNGEIYLQSLSSCLPPFVLSPKKENTILDMAAAPGGKTTEIASLIRNEGKIIACELDQIRAERLKYNVEKQGATCVEVRCMDARKLEEDLVFDQILLDAPCSGAGTVDLNDKQSYISFSEKLVDRSSRMQLALLRKAIGLLKSGGTMVYSTCSILKKENEDVVNAVLKEFPNVSVVPVSLPGMNTLPTLPTSIRGTLLVCPSPLYEGFYVCRLRKK